MGAPNPDPQNPSRAILLITAVSFLIALGFVWKVLLPLIEEEPLFEVQHVRTETLTMLSDRALPNESGPRPIELLPMDETDARLLYGQLTNASNRYDPLLGFRYRPDFEREIDYPEHPDGSWWLRTNDYGLRMEADVRASAPDLRILVIGDSHTDGICNNDEAYAHGLQERLEQALAPRSVEVLNAGKSGYSFYNFLAAPEAFAELEPDLLIVCVYGGNDFTELLLPHLYHQRLGAPPVARIGEDVLARAYADLPAGVPPQGLMQSMLMQTNPHLEPLALDGALRVTRALDERCRELDLPWLGIYLPPMADVQPEQLSEAYRAAERELGLADFGRAVNARLGAAWLSLLEELAIPSLDLTAVLASHRSKRLYWEADHHINIDAHRWIAEALAETVLQLLASQSFGTDPEALPSSG